MSRLKENFINSIALLWLTGLLSSCLQADSYALNFACNLHKKLSEDHLNETILFSPEAVYNSLILAYLGAEGETQAELLKLLQMDEIGSQDELPQHLLNTLKASNGEVSNGIYVAERFEIVPKYQQLLGNYLHEYDFAQSEQTAKQINKQIKTQTEGHIGNMIDAAALSERISALLLSSLHLDATWQVPFDASLTKTQDFHLGENEKISVEMMRNPRARVKYGELPQYRAKMVLMPLSDLDDNNFSMIIMLPDSVQLLKDNLTSYDHSSFYEHLKLQDRVVDLQLPKLKLSSKQSFKQAFKTLGVSTLFDAAKANMAGLVQPADGFHICDIVSRTSLELHEVGIGMSCGCQSNAPPRPADNAVADVEFIADRAFMMSIVDGKSIKYLANVFDVKN